MTVSESLWHLSQPGNFFPLSDIFVNFSCVPTQWQYYRTHLHTYNTQNDTKQIIHRTTQKFGRVRAVPHLCGFYPDICLTTEEKARKNLSQGSRRVPAGTMKIHTHTIRIHRHNNKKGKEIATQHLFSIWVSAPVKWSKQYSLILDTHMFQLPNKGEIDL